MALRTCTTPGCPNLVTRGHCTTHRRDHEQQRGTATQRGYGPQHQTARKALIAALPTQCGYGCGTTITTPTDLVAAHIIDGDPTQGWQASCRQCNERAKLR